MISFQPLSSTTYHHTPEFAGKDIQARWVGKGKELYGLPDEFNLSMYDRLMSGRDPHTGDKLSARLSKVRRMGWDVTLTDEKELSALELVAGDERIGRLRSDGVDHVVSRLEKRIAVRVRKGGKNEDRITGNLVGAAFPHETNRDGAPHAHTHLCIANLSWDKAEGQVKAVELSQVDRNRLQRDYHKFMADGMKKLGYKVKWYGNRYDVPGVPEQVVDKLSTRREQIEELARRFDASADERGARRMSAKSRSKLPLYDRPDKAGLGTREDVQESWVSRLTDFEHHQLRGAVSKAMGTVRQKWRREESRAAFDRMRGHEEAQEPSRGYGRSR